MGALPRPAVTDPELRTLFDELHGLHHRAGWPSLRDMGREVGCSHTTVSTAFSDPRLPRWGLLELLVETLGGDTEQFHRLWLAASRHRPAEEAPPALAPRDSLVPHTLPGDVVAFTGRTEHLAALDALLDDVDTPGVVRIAALTGTAGVGKTALAVHWARIVADRFPDGQLYVNLRGYDPELPVQPLAALESLLRELGVEQAALPQELSLRAARYRTLLSGRRVLVLLDNVRSVDQVRDLLPGDPSAFVLVTSRDALPALVARHGARRIGLDLLDVAESVTLLRALLGARVDAEAGAAVALARAAACLPLALRVAAELALSRPSTPLADLVTEFEAEAHRLDLLDAGDDEYTAVRSVLSWSLTQLPDDAARAFAVLGLHVGPDLDPAAAAAALGVEVRAARKLVDVLVRAHLVDERAGRRLVMHDLLRAYAAELADDLPEAERDAVRDRLDAHYLAQARVATSSSDGDRWLQAELPNLMAIALVGADTRPGHTVAISTTLTRYLDAHAHYTDALVLHERAVDAAVKAQDEAGEAAVLNALGTVHRRLGRYRDASPPHARALAIHRRLGDQRGIAVALHGLGILAFRAGDYDAAVVRLEQARRIFAEAGDRVNEGQVLHVLGVVELKLGHHDVSLAHLEQALALDREIGERTGEGRAANNLGEIYLRLGRLDDADQQYRTALGIAREQGNRAGEGVALTNLATVAQRSGRLAEALDTYAEALSVCREVGYRIGQADALRGVGVVYGLLGRADDGVTHLRMAIDIGREIGEADVETMALNDLAAALRRAGRGDDARDACTAALALAEQTGDRYEQSRAHRLLAVTATDDAAAAQHAGYAADGFAALGLPEADDVEDRPRAESR